MTPRIAMTLVMALGLAGCASTARPPQLDHTPGPPVSVAHGRYTTTLFSVTYPAGWRVITPAADAPAGAIFAAPDNRALIALSVAPLDTLPTLSTVEAGAQQVERRSVTTDGLTLYVAVVAAPDALTEALAQAEAVMASLRGVD